MIYGNDQIRQSHRHASHVVMLNTLFGLPRLLAFKEREGKKARLTQPLSGGGNGTRPYNCHPRVSSP